MALPDPAPQITLEQYLALERQSDQRHEWVNGVAYAMAGGSAEHSAIKTNLTVAVGFRLRGGPGRAGDSDQRVHVPATTSSFYADLIVVCGGFAFASDDEHAVTNPTVIIEVLSESTADYDRGTKFQHYRRLPSLQEVVLVSQDEQRVEIRQRVEEGWLVREITEGPLHLASIDVRMPFEEIFDLSGVRDEPLPRAG